MGPPRLLGRPKRIHNSAWSKPRTLILESFGSRDSHDPNDPKISSGDVYHRELRMVFAGLSTSEKSGFSCFTCFLTQFITVYVFVEHLFVTRWKSVHNSDQSTHQILILASFERRGSDDSNDPKISSGGVDGAQLRLI